MILWIIQQGIFGVEMYTDIFILLQSKDHNFQMDYVGVRIPMFDSHLFGYKHNEIWSRFEYVD